MEDHEKPDKDSEENIIFPAHTTPKKIIPSSSTISCREFQKRLYSWLEEKNLISELRSHLRMLMISKLRKEELVDFCGQQKVEEKTKFSLKQQALNMIIAEHFLREKFFYTLSVFSTEAPGIGVFFDGNKKYDLEKFTEPCVLNMLEMLGIGKTTREAQDVFGMYFRGNNKDGDQPKEDDLSSLLSCFIYSRSKPDFTYFDQLLTSLQGAETLGGDECLMQVLLSLKVPPNIATQITDIITSKCEQRILQFKKREDTIKLQCLKEKDEEIQCLVEKNQHLKNKNKKLVQQKQEFLNKERYFTDKIHELSNLLQEEEKKCGISDRLIKAKVDSARQEVEHQKNVEIERLKSKIDLLERDSENSVFKIHFLNSCLQRSSEMNLQIVENDEANLALSSTESTDSLTDNLLHQVRSRLLELEKESSHLDEKFQKIMIKNKDSSNKQQSHVN